MERVIEDIYDFKDYRTLLNRDFQKRSLANPKYSLRGHRIESKIYDMEN